MESCLESPQSCLGRSLYSSSNGCPAFPYAPQTGHPCVVGSCVYWQHPGAGRLVGVTHPDAHLRLSQGAVAQGCLNPFLCPLPVLYLSVSLCSESLSPTPHHPPTTPVPSSALLVGLFTSYSQNGISSLLFHLKFPMMGLHLPGF